MLKKLMVAGAILLSLASVNAQAAFVATDWKTAGDKLATLDSATGKEWLDLSETKGKSWNTVNSQLSTTYAGWRFPTYNEVVTLLNGYFPNDVTAGNQGFTDPTPFAESFFGQFGHTIYESSSRSAYVFYLNDQAQSRYITIGRSHSTGYTTLQFNNNYFTQASVHSGLAMFLVSDGGTTLTSITNPNLNIMNPAAPVNQTSPESPAPTDVSAPVGLASFGFAMLMLGASARRKAAKRIPKVKQEPPPFRGERASFGVGRHLSSYLKNIRP